MASERAIVVGAGGISGAWFTPLKKEAVEVVAIVDLRPDAARAQAQKFGLESAHISTDLDATLARFREQAQFVVDLTVPDAHCEVTCKALKAGYHVVGEKPMASTMDQAARMVQAAEQSQRLYMISQSRRWEDKPQAIAATVAAGRLGTLTTLNCDFFLGAHFGGFRDEMPSPLVLDMAIHHFDLARMFCGGRRAVSVYAEEFNPHGSWYKGDVAANCLFEMEGGIRFAYRGSWCAEGCHTSWNGDWRIIGDAGTLIFAADQEPRGEVVAGNEGFIRPKKPLEIVASPAEKRGMHGALAEMLRYLRTGQTPQTECHDNIHSLAMVLAAIESSRKGQRVRL